MNPGGSALGAGVGLRMCVGEGSALLADLDAEVPADGAGPGVGRVRGPDERPRGTHDVQALPHLRAARAGHVGPAPPPASRPRPALTMATTGPEPMYLTRRL